GFFSSPAARQPRRATRIPAASVIAERILSPPEAERLDRKRGRTWDAPHFWSGPKKSCVPAASPLFSPEDWALRRRAGSAGHPRGPPSHSLFMNRNALTEGPPPNPSTPTRKRPRAPLAQPQPPPRPRPQRPPRQPASPPRTPPATPLSPTNPRQQPNASPNLS